MELTKEKVATRQLDTAIRLFFDAGDVVSVHTLASAASAVFAGLLKIKGGSTWRQRIVDSFPKKQSKEIINTLREAERFFKHADEDPHAVINFDEKTNDETIIVATLEYMELLRGTGKTITPTMLIFQCWYYAKDPSLSRELEMAQVLFPNLNTEPRFNQLAIGAKVLRQKLAE